MDHLDVYLNRGGVADVLMNKVRSMGNLTANATAAGPNMTK
jgi:hypothetical protein